MPTRRLRPRKSVPQIVDRAGLAMAVACQETRQGTAMRGARSSCCRLGESREPLVRSSWLFELSAQQRAHRANWIPREVPQPFDPQVRLLSVSAGTSLQGAARNPRANPHEHSISLGQGWSSGGCSALVSCAPNRKSGPLIPSLSFPLQLTKVLPAQVARSARRRSTSRLHERARHVWRRGIVKRLLRYRLEGHFRSQSFISRILIDATP